MANYLMPADGGQATAVGNTRSRDDIMSVNNMYRVKIYNKSGTIKFTGFIPPDFTFSLSSQWDAPFANTSLADFAEQGGDALSGVGGNRIKDAIGAAGRFVANNAGTMDKALRFAGASSMHKLASARVWGGPSYMSIDLPIFVDAYSDTKTEVVDTTIALLSLCAPSEKGGLLLPPGPSPLKSVGMETFRLAAGGDAGGGGGGTADAVKAAMSNVLEDSEAFFVDIGNFFSMSPCIIDSVSANFDNVWEDGTGNPISVDFILQVSSYFAVTREDLKKWLKQ